METVAKVEEHYKGIKLTKYFKASKKPKRHGWYEVKYAGRETTVMYYWTGRRWMYEVSKSKGRTGLAPSFSFGIAKGDKWRGLSEEYVEPIDASCVTEANGDCVADVCSLHGASSVVATDPRFIAAA